MNKNTTEYEKDLNEMKEQILKEGNTLLTKRDLLERFCEIDKEYNGRSWNLLQILANINILIGEEPCEDTISRTQALSDYADWYGYGYRENTFYKLLKDMPPVQSKPKTEKCKWIRYDHRTICPKNHDIDNPYWRIPENTEYLKYCPYCGKEIEVTE
jgi:hypothetical protein